MDVRCCNQKKVILSVLSIFKIYNFFLKMHAQDKGAIQQYRFWYEINFGVPSGGYKGPSPPPPSKLKFSLISQDFLENFKNV